jgi:hypothetical protein
MHGNHTKHTKAHSNRTLLVSCTMVKAPQAHLVFGLPGTPQPARTQRAPTRNPLLKTMFLSSLVLVVYVVTAEDVWTFLVSAVAAYPNLARQAKSDKVARMGTKYALECAH